MDWFEKLTGFRETTYDDTRAKLAVEGNRLRSLVNGTLLVSQAFCSALPVSYTRVSPSCWKAFASLVLEAAYEATMWAAMDNARCGGSNVVLLTSLGGGAFGNDESWICAAMARALEMTSNVALDVRIVSHGAPGAALLQVAKAFQ
jgi:hypothetical protein